MENKVIALDYLIIVDIDQKQVLLTMKNEQYRTRWHCCCCCVGIFPFIIADNID